MDIKIVKTEVIKVVAVAIIMFVLVNTIIHNIPVCDINAHKPPLGIQGEPHGH
jgi:hypothetical protein